MKLRSLALLVLTMILMGGTARPIEQERREIGRPGSGSRSGNRVHAIEERARPYRIDRQALLAGDSDGDGVPNSQDPCWFTLADAAAGGALGEELIPGCMALDIIEMPDSLVGPLTDALADAIEYTEMYGGSAVTLGDLEGVKPLVETAVESVRSGDPCTGQIQFAGIADDLLLVEESFATLVSDGYGALGIPSDFEDDVRPTELDLLDMEFLMSQVKMARDAAADLESAVGAVCSVALPGLSTSGVVDRLEDSRRRMVLTDGRVFALAEGMDLSDLASGQEVTITGSDLGYGTATAFSVDVIHPVEIWGGVFYSCAALRVAPIQPFAPVKSGPYLLQDFRGYRYASPFQNSGTVYRLEAGMRLGIENLCRGNRLSLSGPRYSVALHLNYVRKGKGSHSVWLSSDLTAGKEPVPLPYDADPGFPATLTAKHYVQQCYLTGGISLRCSSLKFVGDVKYDLHLVERGSMCNAVYDRTLFDIDDTIPGWFQRTHVKQLISFAVGDGGVPPQFVGEGYGSQEGFPLTTTYPSTAIRLGSQKFAIHTHDILPIFGGNTPMEKRFLLLAYGADHAAGIVWPRAVGYRNQKKYQYSCTLPTVIRDVVDFCGNKPVDAYYKMPFPKGIQWTEGQGNLSAPGRTHSGGYAYDMIQGCGNSILAARSGRVISVTESRNLQVAKWCCQGQSNCSGCAAGCCTILGAQCPGNEMRIRHQDGTIGQYVHMPKNGVIPQLGEVVRRGQPIATVGLVGNTSGPHLHFAARGPGPLTHLALFEAVDHGTATNPQPHLLHCYEPLEGEPIHSNNQMCSTCPPQ